MGNGDRSSKSGDNPWKDGAGMDVAEWTASNSEWPLKDEMDRKEEWKVALNCYKLEY